MIDLLDVNLWLSLVDQSIRTPVHMVPTYLKI